MIGASLSAPQHTRPLCLGHNLSHLSLTQARYAPPRHRYWRFRTNRSKLSRARCPIGWSGRARHTRSTFHLSRQVPSGVTRPVPHAMSRSCLIPTSPEHSRSRHIDVVYTPEPPPITLRWCASDVIRRGGWCAYPHRQHELLERLDSHFLSGSAEITGDDDCGSQGSAIAT